MKKINLLILAMSLMIITAHSQNLTVIVKNVKDAKGNIRVGLFDKEKDFLKKAAVGQVVKAKAGELTVVFEHVQEGDYAISVIHDSNENGELDSNFFGMPKEGFGFSKDAMGSFGPPSFEKAKLKVADQREFIINLRYL